MNDVNHSSQESIQLPLSQESYLLLFEKLNESLSDIMQDVNHVIDQPEPEENCDQIQSQVNSYILHQPKENDHQIQSSQLNLRSDRFDSVGILSLDQARPVSSLPASENWPGPYAFTVSFNPPHTVEKGASWIFSKENNKLYVIKDIPCPVNFATSALITDNVIIRAMALFSSSDNASDKVTRCINHSYEEQSRGIFEAEHLIRCTSKNALYNEDPLTRRHSVIVPYENPAAGQSYSSYLYKFMCYSSCSGGPNRRALMIVFTLERQGKVIGRQKVHLKICACPARDFKREHKLLQVDNVVQEKKPSKRPMTDQLLPSILPKKIKAENTTETKEYCVKTPDKKCYEFLKRMKRMYNMSAQLTKLPKNTRRLIYVSSQSSSSEELDEETMNN